MTLYGFKKTERMVSEKSISRLFSSGSRSLTVFPLKAVFRDAETSQDMTTILVSVSKRHFHHAVDRNRAKRQIREAYRLNRYLLCDKLNQKGSQLDIAFIWMSDKLMDSQKVTTSMVRLLQMLAERI